ncbi:hypothetical protein Q9S36_48080, partial [Microbacterium sp. ARD31]|uniref:hypothetical protein n=1 Tax=Microbacterium sp. ARD31 TaxID=2962576 RepID=UPI0028811683
MPELVETAPDGTTTTQPPSSPGSTEPELGLVGKSMYILATICPAIGALCVGAYTDLDPEKVFPLAFATWAALQGALSFNVVLTEKRDDFRTAWEMVTGFVQSTVGLSTFMYAAGLASRH